MKNRLFSFLASFLCLAVNMAYAEECQTACCDVSVCQAYNSCHMQFYAKFLAGANFLQNNKISGNCFDYQTGYLVGGAIGCQLCDGLSLEAEYAFRRNTIQQIHFFTEGFSRRGCFESSSYMANILWDLPFSACGWWCYGMQPFVGAGIGFDHQHTHAANRRVIFHQKWRPFSWQVMTGIACPIFCNTEMRLEYRFHQGGHFNNHFVGVGLSYHWGL